MFGSGEMSPVGRKIHEYVVRRIGAPTSIRIGILETPTGFEVNAIHGWPERMQKFFKQGLSNYHPMITRVRAWRRDGTYSTNDPAIVDTLLSQDYIYCGAGSPGYAVRHLKDTRAYTNLLSAHKNGIVLCLGSAAAVAVSTWSLPVYEIFKAGADLHWREGLGLFSQYSLCLAIVPHWNNHEGEDFDTTRCWMGAQRFQILRKMLPETATILGIDEQTACIFDTARKTVEIQGKGSVHRIRGGKLRSFRAGDVFPFTQLA